MGNFAKEDISQNELTSLMAGGAELEALQHEIARPRTREPDPADAPHGPGDHPWHAVESRTPTRSRSICRVKEADRHVVARSSLDRRVSVDLYAEQPGVTMSDVTTFRKSIGGTATNVAVATARYGHAVAPRPRRRRPIRSVRRRCTAEHVQSRPALRRHPSDENTLAFAELDPPEDPTIIFYREPAAPDMEIETTPPLLDAVDRRASSGSRRQFAA